MTIETTNGTFNVQPKRGFVSYSQRYNGGMVYAVARVQEGDTFDQNMGMAVAFAKCELSIRRFEEAKAAKVVEDMHRQLRKEQLLSPDKNASRFWSKHIGTACSYLRELRRYRRNQEKVLALVSAGEYAGKTYSEMLKLAHDRVLLEEKKD
jgi:hypothetical protein